MRVMAPRLFRLGPDKVGGVNPHKQTPKTKTPHPRHTTTPTNKTTTNTKPPAGQHPKTRQDDHPPKLYEGAPNPSKEGHVMRPGGPWMLSG